MKPSCSALSAVSLALVALAACTSSSGAPTVLDAGGDAAAVLHPDAGAEVGPDSQTSVDMDGGADAASAPVDSAVLSSSTVLDLNDLKTNPAPHDWFDFRPNVKKLILAGAAESQHVAILWYTTPDGGVGLHYHAKTESVYVIDGTQTDAKGVYPTGSVYFNPPGSGHQITDSTGFFILAYAAPPDFASTSLIGEYTPIRIDTTAADLTTAQPFQQSQEGVRVFAPPLDSTGGLTAAFIETTSAEAYLYSGNYLLVLRGRCNIEGTTFTPNWMVVGKAIEPQPYKVAAAAGSSCLAMGVSL